MEQPMRIFCRANPDLNLACRGDKALLVVANPNDRSQHWIKDSSAVGNVTDDRGERAFALVNVTTGQALVNPNAEEELLLAPYSGHVSVELPMLWSLGEETVDGFREIRALQSTYFDSLTFNAYGGIPVLENRVVGTYRSHQYYDDDLSQNVYYDHTIWKIAPINQ
ncbi:unnamed protein product [Urochloa humidicola]